MSNLDRCHRCGKALYPDPPDLSSNYCSFACQEAHYEPHRREWAEREARIAARADAEAQRLAEWQAANPGMDYYYYIKHCREQGRKGWKPMEETA